MSWSNTLLANGIYEPITLYPSLFLCWWLVAKSYAHHITFAAGLLFSSLFPFVFLHFLQNTWIYYIKSWVSLIIYCVHWHWNELRKQRLWLTTRFHSLNQQNFLFPKTLINSHKNSSSQTQYKPRCLFVIFVIARSIVNIFCDSPNFEWFRW